MAEIRREVARPDENPIHALHRGDGLDFAESRTRLYLDQHAGALVGRAMIVGDPAVAIRPRRHRHAPDAARRIAGGRDRAPRLFAVLHERNQKRPRTHVQNALDQHGVVPGTPHHRLRGPVRHSLQLG